MTRFARKSNKNPEGEIQSEILSFLDGMETLAKKPIYYFRSGAWAFKTEGGYFKTGRAGAPDITILVAGTFIWIEVKAPWKKQSEKQLEAEKQIQFAWWEYFVVTSVLEVKKILTKHIDLF